MGGYAANPIAVRQEEIYARVLLRSTCGWRSHTLKIATRTDRVPSMDEKVRSVQEKL